MRYKACNTGPQGPEGDDGKTVEKPDEIPTGNAGSDGSYKISPLEAYKTIETNVPTKWINEYIHQSELDLLNKDFDKCGEKTAWLNEILSRLDDDDSILNKRIASSIHSIKEQILSGQDPFGYDSSYVSLIEFEYLQQQLITQINLAQKIEEASNRIIKQNQTQEEQRRLISKILKDTYGFIRDKKSEIISQFAATKSMQEEISELLNQLNSLWAQLRDSDIAFKRAVKRESGGCEFEDVLQFGTMVASIAATGGSAAAFITAAGTSISKIKSHKSPKPGPDDSWYDPIVKETKAYSGYIKPAGDKLSEFKDSLQKAKNAISEFKDKNEVVDLPGALGNDYAKLLVNKEKFDRQIEKFLNLEEARQYKRLMDIFVTTANTRNHKILEHDSIVRSIWNGWSSILGWRLDIASAVNSQTYDFSLKLAQQSISNSLKVVKWDILRHMVKMTKCLTYVNGDEVNIDFSDRDVGALSASAANINSLYLRILSEKGNAAEKALNISIPIRELLTPSMLVDLVKGNTVLFKIPENHHRFKLRYGVICNRIFLDDLDHSQGHLSVLLEHQGMSIIRMKDSKLKTFSHQQIRGTFEIDKSGLVISSGDLGNSNQTYIGPSPFGAWKIKAYSNGSLEHLKDSKLVFDITGRPIDI